MPKEVNEDCSFRIRLLFSRYSFQLPYDALKDLCRDMGFPRYAKRAVYEACFRLAKRPTAHEPPLPLEVFADYWEL